ncbi:hypothetical protein [Sphingomonas oryzagri]
MRPTSIRRFELVYALNIVVAVAALLWAFARLQAFMPAMPADTPAGLSRIIPVVVAVMAVVAILIKVLLWHFIARRGSDVARWIFVVLFVLAALSVARAAFFYGNEVLSAGTIPIVSLTISAIDFMLRTICLVLLFQADATAWIKGQRRPANLHDTFS